ncbi:MAG: tRNA-specific adenosine deaminase [Alphaproteobacteria bacterium MarineAlpha6_Bin3]|nr:MAG: tRNA-specific adenosine deaminase [Alphaproteobacteria bacterium MarineAlpha6_Bin3]
MIPNKKIINELKKLALKAKKNDEVPISSILAKKDKIFFSAYNTCHKSKNPLNHAEMIVINKALVKTKQKFLNDFDIYTSLEPCSLCASAISFSRVKRIFFCAYDKKFGAIVNGVKIFDKKNSIYKPKIIGGIEEKFFSQLLKEFFKSKR